MEPWANGLRAALGDHAGHSDHRATVVEAQRVRMVKAQEEHNQFKADVIKVVSDVANNDVGMKAKLDQAFDEVSGMAKAFETHCNSSVGEFKSSIIGAIDPKFEQLRQQISSAPGAAPGLEHTAKVVELEGFSKDITKRLELLGPSVIQIRTTTEVAVTEVRSVIIGSGPAHAPAASPAPAMGFPIPWPTTTTRGTSS